MTDAHKAFLAAQGPVHPLLQQIQANSQIYPSYPGPGVNGTDTLMMAAMASGAAAGGSNPPTDDVSLDIAQEGLQESTSEEVFSNYKHREVVKGCQPHPADIVEAAPLAALELPKESYPIRDSLPEEAITQGKLSCLQLEGIIHACQRHQIVLANGQRAGFFIGDGAGVGKGRQIAGIILDNIARGRTRHIWFTISTDLIVDSRRDLTDIGCHTKVIDGCQELDRETRVLGLPPGLKEGIVFSTYATLVSSVQSGGKLNSARRSRLQQLIDWCGGPEYEGCLIFDECHKAKNFVPNKEQASTKVALAVTEIQRLLPKARVVYCSATGVSDVKNMAFMERLGLWGDGAPFRSFVEFLDTVQKKGLGIAEMLAMEMKSSGMYVSRGLSYRQAEFMTVEVPLTSEQKKVYDMSAALWGEICRSLDIALSRTSTTANRIWTTYWGAHQRFFKQLCMGLKVPAVVAEAKAALETGHCVVIGLQSTGEAALDTDLSQHNLDGPKRFISVCREIIRSFVKTNFPTHKTGNPGTEPVEDEWSAKAKKMLLDYAQQINLPDSPLDELIDKLGGPDQVAEMTGRKGRMVQRWPHTKPVYEQRATGQAAAGALENLNVKERNLFMAGKKFVAIISDAASTGISLHADERAGNKRRRVHITMELPWSADKAVQQLGRSHRSNQSSGPLYKLLTTDLGGERRFAAAVARRLQSLGALTKGDRRAASGADLKEFNFDTPYGRTALKTMYNCICQQQLAPGVNLTKLTTKDFLEFNTMLQESLVEMGLVEPDTLRSYARVDDRFLSDVAKFLNRILGLATEKQNLLFSYFTECLDVIIQNAKKEGRYDEGLQDISAASIQMIGEPKEVFTDLLRGHGTTKLVELEVDRGLDWEHAMTRYENYKDASPMTGFYKSKREMFGSKMFILVTPKENSTHLLHVARPSTGVSGFEQEQSDLLHKYKPIAIDDAKKGWTQSYENSKSSCMHGRHCKHKNTCTVGKRCYGLHLLCGNIATLMTVLEATLLRNGPMLGLSKFESRLRVVRVAVDGGERVVGVRYPEVLIPEVEKTLKEQKLVDRMQRVQAVMAHKQQMAATSQAGDTTLLSQLAPSSSSSSPSSSQEKPYIYSQARVEDVTPVNAKLRAKALRPPVTIKNFFKPKAGASTDDTDGLSQSWASTQLQTASPLPKTSQKTFTKEDGRLKPAQSDLEKDGDDCVVIGKSQESKSSKESDKDVAESCSPEQSIEETEKENHSQRKTRSKKEETSEGKTEQKKETTKRAKKTEASDDDDDDSYVPETRRGTKRKSSQMLTKAKTKQSRTAPTATTKSDSKGKEEKEKRCPICDKKFDPGTWNEEINAHIDNCLIE
ncbi:uncharacterized protein [Littorina saxatilis]|uniref:Uncharacterized protein n=1 Tax=Littorina saxatilis TaxID=31220 RepID=A0AAN9BFT3_9CAEN